MADTSQAGAALAPPLREETIAALRTFAMTPDDDEARALLARHPDLRVVQVVSILVQNSLGDRWGEEQAKRFMDRAALLCGPDWPEGPEMASFLVTGHSALVTTVLEPQVLARLVARARWVSEPDRAEVVPPEMLPELLTLAGIILSLARRYTGDDRLLDEALAVHRRAMEATPPAETELVAARSGVLAAYHIQRFGLTGDRALLDEALAVQQQAIESLPADAFLLPTLLVDLSGTLYKLYVATGRAERLAEAIAAVRRAISLLEPTDQGVGSAGTRNGSSGDSEGRLHLQCLADLARYLGEQHNLCGDPTLIDEAVALARRALDGTPDDSCYRPDRLHGLAHALVRRYELTRDVDRLEEAVDAQRRAVEAMPADDLGRAARVRGLAALLTEMSDAKGDPGLLDEAWSMVEGLETDAPFDKVLLNTARAWLVRHDQRRDDRFAVAAREITAAVEVVERLRQAEPDPVRRRDLAQRFDGMLGDLVANTVRSGDTHRGRRTSPTA